MKSTIETKRLLSGEVFTEVTLPEGLGTCDVMDWVDEHPEVILKAVQIKLKHGLVAVVSDKDHTMSDIEEQWKVETEDLEIVPHKLYNGWERIGNNRFGWLCKKGDKLIYITI